MEKGPIVRDGAKRGWRRDPSHATGLNGAGLIVDHYLRGAALFCQKTPLPNGRGSDQDDLMITHKLKLARADWSWCQGDS